MKYARIKIDDKIHDTFRECLFALMNVESERKILHEEKKKDKRDDKTRFKF